MAQHIENPKHKRHPSLADAGRGVGSGSWLSFGGLFGGIAQAVSEGGWTFRSGLFVLMVCTVVAITVFLAYGGGLLAGVNDGRYPGGNREFWNCNYMTLSGPTQKRLWKAGSGGTTKGCPVLLMP
ncbi:MAG: hypothetical protein WCZ23_09640 [Rhodospirillaceae bacterium]